MSSEDKPLTEEEIRKKYWGQWVAAKVVERDAGGQPVKFRVLSASGDRYWLRDQVVNEEAICILYAGSIPATGGATF